MGKKFSRRKRWVPGIIKENLGNVMHKVLIEGPDTMWHQHVNELKMRLAAWTIPDSSPVTNSESNSSPVTNNPNPASARAEQSREPMPQCRSSRVPKPRRPWSPK